MKERDYYAIRNGLVKEDDKMRLDMLIKAFKLVYSEMDEQGYFAKYLGSYDYYNNFDPGIFGYDIATAIYVKTGQEDIWPIYEYYNSYSEVQLFTMIELLHDCASSPNQEIDSTELKDEAGKAEFRTRMNPILRRYKNIQLSDDGELLENVEDGFEPMFNAEIPTKNVEINQRIYSSIKKFRRAASTVDERRDAIRNLADVLELLRPQIKTVLMSKDENEIYMIANSFGIRHFNTKQKDEYDKPIWHSWIFYCYLATIHACLRLIEKQS